MITIAGYEVRFNRVRSIVFINRVGETAHRVLSVGAATDPETEFRVGQLLPTEVVNAVKEAVR